jgi:hypothetical protein
VSSPPSRSAPACLPRAPSPALRIDTGSRRRDAPAADRASGGWPGQRRRDIATLDLREHAPRRASISTTAVGTPTRRSSPFSPWLRRSGSECSAEDFDFEDTIRGGARGWWGARGARGSARACARAWSDSPTARACSPLGSSPLRARALAALRTHLGDTCAYNYAAALEAAAALMLAPARRHAGRPPACHRLPVGRRAVAAVFSGDKGRTEALFSARRPVWLASGCRLRLR